MTRPEHDNPSGGSGRPEDRPAGPGTPGQQAGPPAGAAPGAGPAAAPAAPGSGSATVPGAVPGAGAGVPPRPSPLPPPRPQQGPQQGLQQGLQDGPPTRSLPAAPPGQAGPPPGPPGPSGGPATVVPGRATGRPAPPRPPLAGPRPVRRRARLTVRRLDPWSVFVVSLVLSLLLAVMTIVASLVLYGVLSGLGVPDSINKTVNDVQGSGDVLTRGRFVGFASLIAAANVVLVTAFSTLVALIYNVVATFTGGVEVTLTERD